MTKIPKVHCKSNMILKYEQECRYEEGQMSVKEQDYCIERRICKILNSIGYLTRSQCKFCNVGVMCSHTVVLQIICAAEFCTN